MLVLDTSARAFHAARNYRAQQTEKMNAALADARAKEEAAFASDGDIPTTSLEATLGRPLAHTAVQTRLAKLNPNLIFLDATANPKGIGIYFRDGVANPESAQYRGVKYTGISFEKGYLPEFDVHHVVDEEYWEEGAPAGSKPKVRKVLHPEHPLTRGWWTLVLRLISAGYIERGKTLRAFGIRPSRQSKKFRDSIGTC